MKRFLSKIFNPIRNLATPHKSFQRLAKERPIILFIWTLSTQLLLSLLILVFLTAMASNIPPGTVDILTNIMYGMVIAFPLFIFCLTVAFHHYARSLGGKGRFFSHYKMMMWAFLYMLGSSMCIAIIINAFCSVFGIAISESAPALVYGATFLIYSIFAMAVAHSLSLTRSIVAHLIMIGCAIGGYFIFQLMA